jgi:hypothetical protein
MTVSDFNILKPSILDIEGIVTALAVVGRLRYLDLFHDLSDFNVVIDLENEMDSCGNVNGFHGFAPLIP